MADRCSLHIKHLDTFKTWLDVKGIAYRPGKGEYQVLQVLTRYHGWQVVYRRNDMPEHYTINNGLKGLVRLFLREKEKNHD